MEWSPPSTTGNKPERSSSASREPMSGKVTSGWAVGGR